jgi:AcrR family transcriptional regulator
MSFRESRRERDSYHHGNLRETLIEAALQFISERGPSGFAFADLARAAGVSAAAPYRHFRDRNALIAEIARRGYETLAAALERAWNDGKPDPVSAIEACGHAYLAFARAEPASYAAMFDTALPVNDAPELKPAADRAFAVMRRAAEVACASHAGPRRPPPLMVALHLWTMAHGTASLFVCRPEAARRALPMAPEDLLEAGLLIYLQSLGLTPPRR